ncbi:transmembrane protein 106C-like isoform X1 [Cyclopterus lumpus]|uniref:transmembrane protein 106C-like isoform X1 n=1 Tax=Cyclopterus lumpus TaxID=8103 RepID=UPI001486A675|nr:transmembrane protein 106C-like isoform X1 [Cyclopterus lumpus]
MGTRWSRSGPSLLPQRRHCERREEDSDNDSLDGLVRREDIAQFPYVEFTGRDSITCPTCQGTGRIPSDQVNELVALIPYSDQRLRPQRTKLYVVLSVVLCLLASSLVAFFLFPRSVVVVDDGIHSVTVRINPSNMNVLMNMTSTLNLSNPNFFSVLVQSVNCQVLYMKTVIGTQQLDHVTTILPLSQSRRPQLLLTTPAAPHLPLGYDVIASSELCLLQVNYTVSVEIGSSAPYVYAFCTMPSIKVHNIVVCMQTTVKTSYMVRTSQNSLEAYRYIDCGSNTTRYRADRLPPLSSSPPPPPLLL